MIPPHELIHTLQLEPHPEGGFYKRTYTSGNNSFSSILFLLLHDNFSAFHRIRSDEQWNWYKGDDIHIHEIDLRGKYTETILSGKEVNENFQHVVKAGHWFASEYNGNSGFALCGCTVVPAFSFANFELGKREELVEKFAAFETIIRKFTRQ